MAQLKLFENPIGDAGMKAFAAAVAGGGRLTRLQMLYLHRIRMGQAGLVALASVISSLPSIRDLVIDSGPLGTEHPQLKAACEARRVELR